MIPRKGSPRARLVAVAASLATITAGVIVVSCHSRSRLVEQCDNGPVGGPPGASEGYFWVGKDEHPSAGKNWREVDPKSLTPEQRTRIHRWH